MENLEFKNEDLYHLLPHTLIEDALDISLPLTPAPMSPVLDRPSPQIPPLESRIHEYLLRNKNKQNVKLNLHNLFELCDFESEVEKEINKFGGMSLFNALEGSKIFEDAADQIKDFLHDKENLPPTRKINKVRNGPLK